MSYPKPWSTWPQHLRKFVRFNSGNPLICCSSCETGLTTAHNLRRVTPDEFDTPNRWWCAKHVPPGVTVEVRNHTWGVYHPDDAKVCFRESMPARKLPTTSPDPDSAPEIEEN